MPSQIHPDDPAFARPASRDANDNTFYDSLGLTTRAHFAALAMQGLLANHQTAAAPAIQIGFPAALVAGAAVEMADALIAALNKVPS